MIGKRKSTGALAPPPKRRKNTSTIEEIAFDLSAREDYLSGFHKRKLQRIKHAKEEATKKERKEKIEARRIVREGRKADLDNHVEAVNLLLKEADQREDTARSEEDVGEAEGKEDIVQVSDIDQEAEYMDEDRLTTVTIEAVEATKEGLQKVVKTGSDDEAEGGVVLSVKAIAARSDGVSKPKRVWTKDRPDGLLKKKKKKFRYESKAERKITRYKERSGNKAKASARKK